MIIGLTGGIASGKSTVSSHLARLGAAIVDADQAAREVVRIGQPALARIVELFGQAVLHEDGTLNRKKLGDIVFADDNLRMQLNAIVHPAVRQWMNERISELEEEQPERLIVADIPLLFEAGLQSIYKEIMLVFTPAPVQLERLMRRDGLTREQAELRLKAQMPIEEKRALADWIIDNSGTPEMTKQQVEQFWSRKGLA